MLDSTLDIVYNKGMKRRWRIHFWVLGKKHVAWWHDHRWAIYEGSNALPKCHFRTYAMAYRQLLAAALHRGKRR